MAKKRNNKPVLKPVPQNKAQEQTAKRQHDNKIHQNATAAPLKRYANILIPAGIALITLLVYRASLNNGITNWDDLAYVSDNPLIRDISGQGLKNIFSASTMGNYHPFTILSYAIEYGIVGLEPWLYHLDSLLWHIVTTVLVYWFVNLLTKRPVAAGITALLFGLHPMHVESVAWISGRKDVIYGAFYVAACIAYVYYVRAASSKRWMWYACVIVSFICSLLGKPVAVVLPVSVLLVDYFEERNLNYKLLIEKMPLFGIAIIFGLKSVADQQIYGALNPVTIKHSFAERIALSSYSLITYLWKCIAPADLCCLYTYPVKIQGTLPLSWFVYPVAAAALIFIIWKYARTNKAVVFGSLFFLVNIALLLQFIPVGDAIIADRYTYIAYTGLFFILGWFVSSYFEAGGKKQLGYVILFSTLGYSFYLGYLSNQRCMAWRDSVSLWSDEISKIPEDNPKAYYNLGFEYHKMYDTTTHQNERKIYYDSAYYLLNKAIVFEPKYLEAHINLGELERSQGALSDAKKNYYDALSIKPTAEGAYLGLAIVYAMEQRLDSSGYCFGKAVAIKTFYPEAHGSFGNYFDMIQKPDSALIEYTEAIKQKPEMYEPYVNRGRLLQKLNRCDEAIKDFEKGLNINNRLGDIYYARSLCYSHNGNKGLALQDVEKAISLGFKQVDNNYYLSLKNKQ